MYVTPLFSQGRRQVPNIAQVRLVAELGVFGEDRKSTRTDILFSAYYHTESRHWMLSNRQVPVFRRLEPALEAVTPPYACETSLYRLHTCSSHTPQLYRSGAITIIRYTGKMIPHYPVQHVEAHEPFSAR